MITKERLEELIEQNAIIYDISSKTYLGQRKLNRFAWIDDDCLCFNKSEYPEMAYLQDLFETEEDARWELEMTATRTETLKLPTWEEFYNSGKSVVFRDAYGDIQELHQFNREIFVNTEYCGFLTKENYIEACKLCLELFKGEEYEK